MNRFLILLLMVGWAFYIVQVNSGDAVRSEPNAKLLGKPPLANRLPNFSQPLLPY